MAGARDRLGREAELSMRMAHLGEQFARVKRLEPVERYLRKTGRRRQTPAEMIAALEGWRAAGAPITITKRRQGGDHSGPARHREREGASA